MNLKQAGLMILMSTLLFSAACKKKVPPAPAPIAAEATATPPPIDRPVLTTGAPRIDSFTAEPARVERGQSITLRWATTNTDTVTLDQGIGAVATSGSRQLFPTATTTYVLLARGGTGSDTRTVTVEVVAPPPIPTSIPTNSGGDGAGTVITLTNQLQDVLFDYNQSEFREDARRALNTDADILKRIFALDQRINFLIEGHADERGSAEYNLGLADRRAIVTRDALVQLGVPANRLRTISFGEEAPVCNEANEGCWQRNRRAHLNTAQ
ncbi:MAG: OmpA family protein [Bryobacteraceae bacterium]